MHVVRVYIELPEETGRAVLADLLGQPGARVLNGDAQTGARGMTSPSPLTAAERAVLGAVTFCDSTDEIAARLSVSAATVKAHLQSTFQKLGVRSRARAVGVALREGWLSIHDIAPLPVTPSEADRRDTNTGFIRSAEENRPYGG